MRGIWLSVITPAKNAMRTIARCIDSVARQAADGVEHVVVDGGSTDGTAELLRNHEARTEFWSSEPDRGIADAFNRGVRRARGQWLVFLGADDELWPGASRVLQQEIRTDSEASIVYGDCIFEEASGRYRYRIRPERHLAGLRLRQVLRHPASAVRRDAFDRVGPFDVTLRYAMDYDWMLRAFRGSEAFHYVPEVLALVRGGGVSLQNQWETIQESRRVALRGGASRLEANAAFAGKYLRVSARRLLMRGWGNGVVVAYRALHPRFRRDDDGSDG